MVVPFQAPCYHYTDKAMQKSEPHSGTFFPPVVRQESLGLSTFTSAISHPTPQSNGYDFHPSFPSYDSFSSVSNYNFPSLVRQPSWEGVSQLETPKHYLPLEHSFEQSSSASSVSSDEEDTTQPPVQCPPPLDTLTPSNLPQGILCRFLSQNAPAHELERQVQYSTFPCSSSTSFAPALHKRSFAEFSGEVSESDDDDSSVAAPELGGSPALTAQQGDFGQHMGLEGHFLDDRVHYGGLAQQQEVAYKALPSADFALKQLQMLTDGQPAQREVPPPPSTEQPPSPPSDSPIFIPPAPITTQSSASKGKKQKLKKAHSPRADALKDHKDRQVNSALKLKTNGQEQSGVHVDVIPMYYQPPNDAPYKVRLVAVTNLDDGLVRIFAHGADVGGVVERKSNISRLFGKFESPSEKLLMNVIGSHNHTVGQESNILTDKGVKRFISLNKMKGQEAYKQWLLKELIPRIQQGTRKLTEAEVAKIRNDLRLSALKQEKQDSSPKRKPLLSPVVVSKSQRAPLSDSPSFSQLPPSFASHLMSSFALPGPASTSHLASASRSLNGQERF